MDRNRTPFRLDREQGKFLGVCAGIADHFGVDPTLVRVGMAVAIVATFPIVLVGYLVLALIAGRGTPGLARRRPAPADERLAVDPRIHDIDARMRAIEAQLTSGSARLEREIEALR